MRFVARENEVATLSKFCWVFNDNLRKKVVLQGVLLLTKVIP
jgi:hypothetical protein